MNRDEKAAVVDEIAEQIGAAEAVYAVDYRGITVSQIADLRAKLRAELIDIRQRAGIPMLIITHDASDVAAFGGKTVHVDNGRVVE